MSEVESIATPATLTPQNAFPLCGSLENEDAITQIGTLLLNEKYGLRSWCISDSERWLCRHYQQRLTRYPDTTRAEWARLKELCLLHHGSPIAAAIDTMASAHRTNAIAEAAIRATGDKLYLAAARFSADDDVKKPVDKAQGLFRQVLAGAIEPPSEHELAI